MITLLFDTSHLTAQVKFWRQKFSQSAVITFNVEKKERLHLELLLELLFELPLSGTFDVLFCTLDCNCLFCFELLTTPDDVELFFRCRLRMHLRTATASRGAMTHEQVGNNSRLIFVWFHFLNEKIVWVLFVDNKLTGLILCSRFPTLRLRQVVAALNEIAVDFHASFGTQVATTTYRRLDVFLC